VSSQPKIRRAVPPTSDRLLTGLIAYDPKDPDTKGPPISQLRPLSDRFNGVQLAMTKGAQSVDQLVSPEEAIRIAMTRQ
jgi:hypothetical protein